MTDTTQPDPQVRVYPEGWDQCFIVVGDEADGTARVPFCIDGDDVQDYVKSEAIEAERLTGVSMEVFRDVAEGVNCWSYRPQIRPARAPLTATDVPAGEGPASLHITPSGGRPALWFKADDGTLHFIRWAAGPGDTPAARALWDHLVATITHVTTKEDA